MISHKFKAPNLPPVYRPAGPHAAQRHAIPAPSRPTVPPVYRPTAQATPKRPGFPAPRAIQRMKEDEDGPPKGMSNIEWLMKRGPKLSRDAPIGFGSRENFTNATRPLMHALRELDPTATLMVAGSSVTDQRFGTYEPFGQNSDYDFGVVVSNDVFRILSTLFPHHTGLPHRTRPIGVDNLRSLRMWLDERGYYNRGDAIDRIIQCMKQLQNDYHHEVNLMFFDSVNESKSGRVTITRDNTPPRDRDRESEGWGDYGSSWGRSFGYGGRNNNYDDRQNNY